MIEQKVEPSELVKAFWFGDPSGDFVPQSGEAGYDEKLAREKLEHRLAEIKAVVEEP